MKRNQEKLNLMDTLSGERRDNSLPHQTMQPCSGPSEEASEGPVQRGGKSLFRSGIVGRRPAGYRSCQARSLHEVTDGKPLPYRLLRMFLAPGVQNHDHPGHQERGQRNVLGDDEIAGFGVLGDVSVCHIGSAIHADGHDERVSRRRLEPLVCHEDGCHLEPLRRPEDQLLHVPRRGVRVYPDLQVCPPENEALRVLVVKLPKKRPRMNTDERHGLLLDPRCSFGHAEFSYTGSKAHLRRAQRSDS